MSSKMCVSAVARHVGAVALWKLSLSCDLIEPHLLSKRIRKKFKYQTD